MKINIILITLLIIFNQHIFADSYVNSIDLSSLTSSSCFVTPEITNVTINAVDTLHDSWVIKRFDFTQNQYSEEIVDNANFINLTINKNYDFYIKVSNIYKVNNVVQQSKSIDLVVVTPLITVDFYADVKHKENLKMISDLMGLKSDITGSMTAKTYSGNLYYQHNISDIKSVSVIVANGKITSTSRSGLFKLSDTLQISVIPSTETIVSCNSFVYDKITNSINPKEMVELLRDNYMLNYNINGYLSKLYIQEKIPLLSATYSNVFSMSNIRLSASCGPSVDIKSFYQFQNEKLHHYLSAEVKPINIEVDLTYAANNGNWGLAANYQKSVIKGGSGIIYIEGFLKFQ